MNKLFLFLAFAVFALVACSEDKSESHSELCAKTPLTKECLVGRWYLERVVSGEFGDNDFDCNKNGRDLKLEKNGDFSFEGGIHDLRTKGKWKLNEAGTSIEIECIIGDCSEGFDRINADINVQGIELRVSANGYASFSQCEPSNSKKLTEVFSWQGDK